MSAPPSHAPVLRPRRDSAAIICLVIGLLSFVAALAIGSNAGKKADSAALDRGAASRSAADASSSAAVARSLPSPQDVRARFPLPPGAFTKPGDEPNRGTFWFYTRGLTYEQVKAFYTQQIPRISPALGCRFDLDVAPSGKKIGQECELNEDVDFGHIDVWFSSDNLQPGEVFIRLTLTALE